MMNLFWFRKYIFLRFLTIVKKNHHKKVVEVPHNSIILDNHSLSNGLVLSIVHMGRFWCICTKLYLIYFCNVFIFYNENHLLLL